MNDSTKTNNLVGLELKKLRGLGFDGAAVMSGSKSGTQKLHSDISYMAVEPILSFHSSIVHRTI